MTGPTMIGRMMTGPGPLNGGALWTAWTPNVVVIVAAIAAAIVYHRAVRRAGRQGPWPRWRIVCFDVGLALAVYVACSFLGVYGRVLFWVFTVRVGVSLLVVPLLLGAGAPVALAARARRSDRPVAGWVRRLGRWIKVPGIGPLLLLVCCGVLFFTPALDLSLRDRLGYDVLPLVLVVVGLALALPVTDEGVTLSSAAYAALLGLGLLEFALDAVPGIALRLRGTLVAPGYWGTPHRSWGPSPLADQHSAGDWLWFFGEAADLPFLILLVIAWMRSDASEAARADLQDDTARADLTGPGAARAVTGAHPGGGIGADRGGGSGGDGGADLGGDGGADPGADGGADPADAEYTAPWWETDPRIFGEERARRSGWGRPDP